MLLDKQLYLIKIGHFSYQDVDTMPLYELEYFYSALVAANNTIEDELDG